MSKTDPSECGTIHKLEIKEEENDILSPVAQELKNNKTFSKDKTINLYSSKINKLEIEEQFLAQNTNETTENIVFKSEISNSFEFKSAKSDNETAEFAIIFDKSKEQEKLFEKYPPNYEIGKEKVLQVEIKDNPATTIEPILYTAFLMRGSDIVSDPWFFSQTQTKDFFEKAKIPLNLNLKAGFHINTDPSETVLLIFASRVIQVNAGSDVNDYYLKESSKTKELAEKSVNLSFPRCNNVWNPFAFTFAMVSDIISKNEIIELPQLFAKDSFFKVQEVKDMLKKARNKSYKQYPITLKLSAELIEVPQPQTVTKNGFSLIHSVNVDPVKKPAANFRNEMSVKVVTASLKLPSKVKGRNIVAKVSMKNGNEESGKIERDRYNNENAESATTVCFYHETKPFINDTFIISLPYVLDRDASIRVDLFHAIAQKSKEQWSEIGYAEMPFFSKDGEMVAEGTHDIPVIYKGMKKELPVEDNHLTIEVGMKSSLFMPNDKLFEFMMKGREDECDSTLLEEVEPELILQNLVEIIDVCIRGVPKSGASVIKALIIITKAVNGIFPEYQEFITNYASKYALQENPDESYPEKLLDSYKSILDVSDFNGGEDIPFVDFVLILIVKSIKLSHASNVTEQLAAFSKSFANSVFKTINVGLIQCKSLMLSFARFVNMIGSIGLIEAAAKMVNEVFSTHDQFAQNQTADNIAFYFLKNAWNPVFFLESITKCDATVRTVISALEKAKNNSESLPIQGIYDIILDNAAFYSKKENELIVEKLYDSLGVLCPASELPFSSGSEIHRSLSFLVYILFYIREENFMTWWNKFDKKKALFDSLHFLLEKVSLANFQKFVDSNAASAQENLEALEKSYGTQKKSGGLMRNFKSKRGLSVRGSDTGSQSDLSLPPVKKEGVLTEQMKRIIYISQIAVINLLQTFVKGNTEKLSNDVGFAIYHVLCSNLVAESLPRLVSLLINMIRSKGSFALDNPPMPKFIARVMELSRIYKDAFSVVDELFKVDHKKASNTNRAKAICIRALNLIKGEVDPSIYPNKGEGKWFLEHIKKIHSLKNEGSDQYGDTLYRKAMLLKYSPDAQFDALGELIDFHHQNGYFAEELQVRMMRCALIADNLALLKKIDDIWDTDHAADSFASLCENYKDVIAPFSKPLGIASFCDSPQFSLTGFIKEVIDAIKVATESKYYEQALSVSEFAIPLLESNNMFAAAGEVLSEVAVASKELSGIKPSVDRLLGRYYRVTFYGKQWGADDKKCYIYREKNLTNLYTMMGRIRDEYTKKFGACEAIMESGNVDVSKLDPKKAYFQPTSVDALLEEEELKTRKTSYEKGSHITKFYLDAPFTKSGKAQGTVETQWLRRTIIIPEVPMPCATKRVPVKETQTVEYEPIRVACRQLRERVGMLETAVQNGEGQTIQQLLSGSLLVQVNEGPSRMAEVFLADKGKTKYQEMLRGIFKDFLVANKEGLKFHANYIINNPMFAMMQHEMEAGYESLSEKLSKFM